MMRRSLIVSLLVLIALVVGNSDFAYPQKVGLVLSGGGTKGIAHIGVIKALEEEGVPITYITGTSMGAIIGGLYASGYSPEDMLRLLKSKEFPNWVTGTIDEQYIYYFKEKEPDASWFSFNFNYDSLVLPSLIPANIVSPLRMDYAFMEIFASAAAAASYNFDSLFVPFRCVAADIAENKAIVLKSGDLGSAIRASMTFPFYFKPIRIDGKLLFDGGMYNNFPADVMKQDFRHDIMIGCKAASNYPPPQDNNILSQLQTMLMAKTDYKLQNDNDILISLDLPPSGLIDFSLSEAYIDSGYVATKRKMKEIRAHVHDSVSHAEVDQRRLVFTQRKPPIFIDSITTHNLNKKQAHYLRKVLVQQNRCFGLDLLKPQYFKVIADDKIEAIYPVLKYCQLRNAYELDLNVEKEKNLSVRIGGNISSKPINTAYFGILYKYLGNQALTLTANTYIGRFYSSGYLGARTDFASRLPYFIEGHLCFSQWDYFKTKTYFFEDKTPSYLIKNENHVELDLGLPVGNKGKIRIGYALGHIRNDYYQTNHFTRQDTTDRSFLDFTTPILSFEINSLNKKEYANKGIDLLMEYRYIMGRERYEPGSTSIDKSPDIYKKWHNWHQFKLKYQNYFEHIRPMTFGFTGEIILSNLAFFHNYTATMLMAPAFEQLPESRTLFMPTYRAHTYASGGLQAIFHIISNVDLRLEGYIFQPYEEYIEQMDQTTRYGKLFAKRYFTGSMTLVWNGPVAPVSLSLNYFEKSDEELSITFNIGYLIFNRKAIN